MIMPLVKSITQNYFSYLCCGFSKGLSPLEGFLEHPKHMLQLKGKKIFTVLSSKFLFTVNLVLVRTLE